MVHIKKKSLKKKEEAAAAEAHITVIRAELLERTEPSPHLQSPAPHTKSDF